MTSSDLNGRWRDVDDAATPGEHNSIHRIGLFALICSSKVFDTGSVIIYGGSVPKSPKATVMSRTW